jgi:hypothetical protein
MQLGPLTSESRDGFLRSALHPAVADGIIQAQGGFVHKEQLEITLFCPLFSSSSSWAAGWWAVLSCLAPKSFFGRRKT